jgi:predicted transposase YbfD/YdcC
VTLDAMGCQTEIAKAICDKQADYVLAVKSNQNNPLEDSKEYFDWAVADKFQQTCYTQNQTVDGDYGHIEVRRCYATDDCEWLRRKAEWKGLRSIAMVESERSLKGEEAGFERRYSINSLSADAKDLNGVIRSH